MAKHFFSETAEQGSISERLAREAFAAAHPGERIVRATVRVEELERIVVLVQHGPLLEKRYTCYAVAKGTREVTVIDDATLYLPR